MKAFISYATPDKKTGAAVKLLLSALRINAFLAHEDIAVSEEWKARILHELRTADIFIPLLSVSFKASQWAPQEVGFAFNRNEVLIIPLSLDGTWPFGLIDHIQGKRLPDAEAVPLAFILSPVLARFGAQFMGTAVTALAESQDALFADQMMGCLSRHFDSMTAIVSRQLCEAAINNAILLQAPLSKSNYLPAFIESRKRILPQEQRTELEYLLMGRPRPKPKPMRQATPTHRMQGSSHGHFKSVTSTIVDGEDLDIPTFMRKEIDVESPTIRDTTL